MRTFLAVDIPARIREDLHTLSDDFSRRFKGLRTVRPDEMHITLKFAARMDDVMIPEIQKTLQAASYSDFEISVQGLGIFPQYGIPRVLWAGIESPGLIDLYGSLITLLGRFPFDSGDRDFHPHLTLARIKDMPGLDFRPLVESHAQTRWGLYRPEGMTLYKSELYPEGPRHTILGAYPFQAQESI